MNKLWILILLCNVIHLSAQKKVYSFESSPSFHNGFSIEIDRGGLLNFSTQNTYYVLDSLKKNYSSFPDFSTQQEFFKENKYILSNSRFEKQLSVELKDELEKLLDKITNTCEHIDEEKFGFDGIIFNVNTPNGKSCKVWSPSEQSEIGKLIIDLLSKIKSVYHPNAFVDKYIFDNNMYFDRVKSFEVISQEPLYIKLYQMPSLGCSNFEMQINKLPKSHEIYVDITELSSFYLDEECLINTINSRFKSVKIIQSKEVDRFNKL